MSTPNLLSEAEAWREVAQHIAEGGWRRDLNQDGFLCLNADRLQIEGRVSGDVADSMRERVASYLNGGVAFHDTDPLEVDRAARVLGALWLALDAEDDLSSQVSA